jgi:hypothetical protein
MGFLYLQSLVSSAAAIFAFGVLFYVAMSGWLIAISIWCLAKLKILGTQEQTTMACTPLKFVCDPDSLAYFQVVEVYLLYALTH